MEEETAPKKQFRLSKKTILLFLLILSFVMILLSVYFFFFYNQEDSSEEMEPVKEEEGGSLGTVELTFEDDNQGDSEPIRANKVKIKSTGQVYEKEITVEGKPVKLFILKSVYYNDIQGVEKDLDVIVGILFDGDYNNILNWWTYNLVIDEIDIDSLGNEFFKKSYFESIFKSGTSWEYLYYSNDSSVPVTDEYLQVVKEVFKEEDLEKLEENLTMGESEGLILMPHLIYEASD